ncbi:hypothetical protein GWE18_29000 [Bradyrhizobium sp. CSA112]|nr:hypothetical protein [Bradyrhizobium sp. CSA112]
MSFVLPLQALPWFTTVIPRESGVSSTPQPLGSNELLWDTGSPAFAGDDDLICLDAERQNDRPNTFAPEGASRCRALASGLMGRAAGRKEHLSEKWAG